MAAVHSGTHTADTIGSGVGALLGRARLGSAHIMSAACTVSRIAETYRMPLPILKNREQDRRHPDAPAAAYLLELKLSSMAATG
jgi:hypothetical protein